MASGIDLKGIPHAELRPKIERIRKLVKEHPVTKEICDKYGVELDEIDLVPICFAKLDVSARTDHGVIYLNIRLADDIDKNAHYLIHELNHFFQQGRHQTKGSDSGDYLENPEEIESFQNQVEYISDTQGKPVAEQYVERVLDKHDAEEDEDKKDELMAKAFRLSELMKLSYTKKYWGKKHIYKDPSGKAVYPESIDPKLTGKEKTPQNLTEKPKSKPKAHESEHELSYEQIKQMLDGGPVYFIYEGRGYRVIAFIRGAEVSVSLRKWNWDGKGTWATPDELKILEFDGGYRPLKDVMETLQYVSLSSKIYTSWEDIKKQKPKGSEADRTLDKLKWLGTGTVFFMYKGEPCQAEFGADYVHMCKLAKKSVGWLVAEVIPINTLPDLANAIDESGGGKFWSDFKDFKNIIEKSDAPNENTIKKLEIAINAGTCTYFMLHGEPYGIGESYGTTYPKTYPCHKLVKNPDYGWVVEGTSEHLNIQEIAKIIDEENNGKFYKWAEFKEMLDKGTEPKPDGTGDIFESLSNLEPLTEVFFFYEGFPYACILGTETAPYSTLDSWPKEMYLDDYGGWHYNYKKFLNNIGTIAGLAGAINENGGKKFWTDINEFKKIAEPKLKGIEEIKAETNTEEKLKDAFNQGISDIYVVYKGDPCCVYLAGTSKGKGYKLIQLESHSGSEVIFDEGPVVFTFETLAVLAIIIDKNCNGKFWKDTEYAAFKKLFKKAYRRSELLKLSYTKKHWGKTHVYTDPKSETAVYPEAGDPKLKEQAEKALAKPEEPEEPLPTKTPEPLKPKPGDILSDLNDVKLYDPIFFFYDGFPYGCVKESRSSVDSPKKIYKDTNGSWKYNYGMMLPINTIPDLAECLKTHGRNPYGKIFWNSWPELREILDSIPEKQPESKSESKPESYANELSFPAIYNWIVSKKPIYFVYEGAPCEVVYDYAKGSDVINVALNYSSHSSYSWKAIPNELKIFDAKNKPQPFKNVIEALQFISLSSKIYDSYASAKTKSKLVKKPAKKIEPATRADEISATLDKIISEGSGPGFDVYIKFGTRYYHYEMIVELNNTVTLRRIGNTENPASNVWNPPGSLIYLANKTINETARYIAYNGGKVFQSKEDMLKFAGGVEKEEEEEEEKEEEKVDECYENAKELAKIIRSAEGKYYKYDYVYAKLASGIYVEFKVKALGADRFDIKPASASNDLRNWDRHLPNDEEMILIDKTAAEAVAYFNSKGAILKANYRDFKENPAQIALSNESKSKNADVLEEAIRKASKNYLKYSHIHVKLGPEEFAECKVSFWGYNKIGITTTSVSKEGISIPNMNGTAKEVLAYFNSVGAILSLMTAELKTKLSSKTAQILAEQAAKSTGYIYVKYQSAAGIPIIIECHVKQSQTPDKILIEPATVSKDNGGTWKWEKENIPVLWIFSKESTIEQALEYFDALKAEVEDKPSKFSKVIKEKSKKYKIGSQLYFSAPAPVAGVAGVYRLHVHNIKNNDVKVAISEAYLCDHCTDIHFKKDVNTPAIFLDLPGIGGGEELIEGSPVIVYKLPKESLDYLIDHVKVFASKEEVKTYLKAEKQAYRIDELQKLAHTKKQAYTKKHWGKTHVYKDPASPVATYPESIDPKLQGQPKATVQPPKPKPKPKVTIPPGTNRIFLEINSGMYTIRLKQLHETPAPPHYSVISVGKNYYCTSCEVVHFEKLDRIEIKEVLPGMDAQDYYNMNISVAYLSEMINDSKAVFYDDTDGAKNYVKEMYASSIKQEKPKREREREREETEVNFNAYTLSTDPPNIDLLVSVYITNKRNISIYKTNINYDPSMTSFCDFDAFKDPITDKIIPLLESKGIAPSISAKSHHTWAGNINNELIAEITRIVNDNSLKVYNTKSEIKKWIKNNVIKPKEPEPEEPAGAVPSGFLEEIWAYTAEGSVPLVVKVEIKSNHVYIQKINLEDAPQLQTFCEYNSQSDPISSEIIQLLESQSFGKGPDLLYSKQLTGTVTYELEKQIVEIINKHAVAVFPTLSDARQNISKYQKALVPKNYHSYICGFTTEGPVPMLVVADMYTDEIYLGKININDEPKLHSYCLFSSQTDPITPEIILEAQSQGLKTSVVLSQFMCKLSGKVTEELAEGIKETIARHSIATFSSISEAQQNIDKYLNLLKPKIPEKMYVHVIAKDGKKLLIGINFIKTVNYIVESKFIEDAENAEYVKESVVLNPDVLTEYISNTALKMGGKQTISGTNCTYSFVTASLAESAMKAISDHIKSHYTVYDSLLTATSELT
jgi:hypothetical protein